MTFVYHPMGHHSYHRWTVTSSSPIDGYLDSVSPDQREALQRVRDRVKRIAPDAVELISYGMPAFKLHGRFLLSYAAWKRHCSIYPMTGTFLAAHADDLEGYGRTKGSLHFTTEMPLPDELLDSLIRERVAELEAERGQGERAKPL